MGILDEKLFEELGLAYLTDGQRKNISPIIREEMEFRIGKKLSLGLSDQQVREFETIIENDIKQNMSWLKANAPNYQQNKVYQNLKDKGYKGADLINEVTSSLWLLQNRPDYPKIVEACKKEICFELSQYKKLIIAEN